MSKLVTDEKDHIGPFHALKKNDKKKLAELGKIYESGHYET